METHAGDDGRVSRRTLLAGSAALLAGGGGGSGITALAACLSLLSLLNEKVGYPWTTMPDMLMVHAAAGFGGHGTLCGALAGAK